MRSVWHCMDENQRLRPRLKADTPPDYFRSSSCLFVPTTQKGSAPTLTSRTNVVFGSPSWNLLSFSKIYHVSEVLPAPDIFFSLADSFTPCHIFYLLSLSRDPTQSHAGLQSTKSICYCVMDGLSSFHFPCDNFQLISCAFSGTNILRLFCLEFPRGVFGMGCSWPLLKEYYTRQYLCSCPPGTATKIK